MKGCLGGVSTVFPRIDAPRASAEFVERLATVLQDTTAGIAEEAVGDLARATPARNIGRRTEDRTALATGARKTAAPTVILVSRQRCSDCAALRQTSLSGRRARMLLAYFSVLNLDLDSSEPFAAPDGRRTTERAWLGELGVDSAPCLLILSAEGLPVGTVVARPPDRPGIDARVRPDRDLSPSAKLQPFLPASS